MIIHSTLPEASGGVYIVYIAFCIYCIHALCTYQVHDAFKNIKYIVCISGQVALRKIHDQWDASREALLQNISCIFENILNFLGYPKHPNKGTFRQNISDTFGHYFGYF